MTIEELYEWADENNVLDFEVAIPLNVLKDDGKCMRVDELELLIDKVSNTIVIGGR